MILHIKLKDKKQLLKYNTNNDANYIINNLIKCNISVDKIMQELENNINAEQLSKDEFLNDADNIIADYLDYIINSEIYNNLNDILKDNREEVVIALKNLNIAFNK